MNELEALVFQALGQASMCWSETPKGVFQDQQVVKIGENLIAAIKAHEEQAIQKAVAACTGSEMQVSQPVVPLIDPMKWLNQQVVIKDTHGNIIAQSRNIK
jgi:hypothetical protein